MVAGNIRGLLRVERLRVVLPLPLLLLPIQPVRKYKRCILRRLLLLQLIIVTLVLLRHFIVSSNHSRHRIRLRQLCNRNFNYKLTTCNM